jgi:hypothetical protein
MTNVDFLRHCERKRSNPFHGSAETRLDCFVAIAPRNDEFDRKLPDGQITSCFPKWSVQPLLQKYFPSFPTQISSLSRAVLFRQEGRLAIVTDVGQDAVDAAASGDVRGWQGGS